MALSSSIIRILVKPHQILIRKKINTTVGASSIRELCEFAQSAKLALLESLTQCAFQGVSTIIDQGQVERFGLLFSAHDLDLPLPMYIYCDSQCSYMIFVDLLGQPFMIFSY